MTQSEDVSAYIRAVMEQRFAEEQALDEAAAAGLLRDRERAGNGASVVFSVRLNRAELDALEREAVLLDLKPSVLARNLIRSGLAQRTDCGNELADALERLGDAVSEVRTLALTAGR